MIICLAAGRGERLKPITTYLHKAMIPFCGLPFLAYSLCSLDENVRVTLVVNYLSQQIKAYFGVCFRGRRINYFTQQNPAGTGDALFQIFERYKPHEPVIVWQADQLIYRHEFAAISKSDANAILYSRANGGRKEIGLWKVRPSTLKKMREFLKDGEYKALPVIEADGYHTVTTARKKLELSFDEWLRIEKQCRLLKQRYPIESR
jgi:NDP-sugar pyrophosphorylase family protein